MLEGITDERQRARRELLHELDTLGQGAAGRRPRSRSWTQCEEKAYDLILGDAGKVFDLTQEKDEVRDRYGRTTFGQSCLAARRLVEDGRALRHDQQRRLGHAQAALRGDAPEAAGARPRHVDAARGPRDQRGLLDSTIVWWSGEFGRTPKVQWEEPWNGGRSHFGRVLLGGRRRRRLQGRHTSSARPTRTAEDVAERPVEPHDLLGSMYTQLGIDPDGALPNPRGLDVQVLPPSEKGRGRGLLTEIMG